MSDIIVLPQIEWEPLSVGGLWKFDLPENTSVGPEFQTIEVSRAPDWRIQATALGIAKGRMPDVAPRNLQAGQVIVPEPEVSATRGSTLLTLREANLGGISGKLVGEWRRHLSAASGRIVFGDPGEALNRAETCFVWCLNGPREEFPFTKGTERKRALRFERDRVGIPKRVRELEDFGISFDTVAVPPPESGITPAALAFVPKGVMQDDDLRPVSLEFRLKTPAILPEWPVLDVHLQALSFFIGRRLIPVGYTLFDNEARQTLHELRSAWSVDLQADCARPSMHPVPLDDPETLFARLVPRFAENAKSLGLLDAMWLVWLSHAVPLEASLPSLATSLEGIMSAWFRSTKTKSKGKYMPDKDWLTISDEAVKNLQQALGAHPHAARITRRVQGANNFGVNERFEQFFDEIRLPVGAVELAAIRARNKAAHGGSFTALEYQALGDMVRAYHTIIHRVILKLLQWDGLYVDYSTYGFPSRPLAPNALEARNG